jgi:hypothetical protein
MPARQAASDDMALALLRFADTRGGEARFDVELGRNRWYVYAIGDATTEQVHGIEVLADPAVTSELIGPLPPEARGRTTLAVPVEAFSRERRFMQLMSFRTQDRIGPAVSSVTAVPPGAWRLGGGTAKAASLAPPRRLRATRGTVPFTLVEATSRGPYSTAMFWGALLSALPAIIPMVAPLVSNLLKGLMGGAGGGGDAAGGQGGGLGPITGLIEQVGQLLQKPEAKDVLQKLLGSIAQPQAGGGTAIQSSLPGVHIRPTLAHAQFIDGGIITGPALAGLLGGAMPALLPMLQGMAGPGMFNTLFSGGSPERTLAGLTDLVMDPNQRQYTRLWQHTPQVGPNVLPALLVQMQTAAPTSPMPAYRRVGGVKLAFDGLVSQTVNGTARVLFRSGRDWTFAVSLATPKPISRAELHWQVKHPLTLATLAHAVVTHERLETGPLPPVVIPAATLASLAPDDYPISVALIWRNRKGERIGARQPAIITLAGEFLFDRTEDVPTDTGGSEDDAEEAKAGEPIALADVQAHRDYWHKIWEGGFTDQTHARRIECKYYYALEDRRDVARMQTIGRRAQGEQGEPVLRLKTGLLLGAEPLNALLPTLGDVPAVDAERLAALRSPDFRRRFAQAALARLTLRGRSGERAALWVYPEMKLQRVVLKRAAAVDGSGQITELAEEAVTFPMPVLAHFIATKTER